MDQATVNPPVANQIDGAGPVIGIILQSTALIAPVASIYAPLSMAPLSVIAALGIGISAILQHRRLALLGRPMLTLLGLLVLWGTVSSLWSINPRGSILTALQLLGIFISGAVVVGGVARLSGAEAARIGRWLVTGMIIALAVYTIEILFDSPIQWLIRVPRESAEGIYSPFNRGLCVLVLLLSPAVVMLRRGGNRPLSFALFAAALAIVSVYFGGSVALAVFCGVIAGFVASLGGGRMIRLFGWLVAVLILAAPFVAKEALTPATMDAIGKEVSSVSIMHRLVIWRFVSAHALERPLTGWGLDAARAFPENKTKVPVTTRSCQPPCVGTVEQLPLHAHNMALQWWLELGLPGALLGAGLLLWLFHLIPRQTSDPVEQALLTGQLTAGTIVAGLSYGAWQSWWLAAMLLAMAFSAVALRSGHVLHATPSSTRQG